MIPRGLKLSEMICIFFEHVLERSSGIKVDANHLQISSSFAKHMLFYSFSEAYLAAGTSHTHSGVAGSDATPC